MMEKLKPGLLKQTESENLKYYNEMTDKDFSYKSEVEIASENLTQALLAECNRVREIIKEYKRPELEGATNAAVFLMKYSIIKAEKAIGIDDPIAMLIALEDLQGYEI